MPDAGRPSPARLGVAVPFAVATLIWGSTWLVIRGQIATVPAAWSVSYRFALAGLAMLAVARARGQPLVPGRAGLPFAALLGLLQFAGNYNLVYLAERHVTSGLVAVVFALLIVPNALFGRFFLGQAVDRRLLAGAAVAVAGVALLFLHEARGDPRGPGEALTGIALTLAAVIVASLANVMQASDRARALPLDATLGQAMLIGAAADAALACATAGPPAFDGHASYWLGIVYLAIFGSAVAFTLYYGVVRAIGPARAAYSSVLQPVIAMALSTAFENYRWSLLAAAGAALALAGLMVALSARRPAR